MEKAWAEWEIENQENLLIPDESLLDPRLRQAINEAWENPEKENAVADFRKLIGATNPAEAEEGTIRKQFAESLSKNAVHGSDSDENACIEGAFHFSGCEIF